MAEILGVGLTHYPPLCTLDKDMAAPLLWALDDPNIPEDMKDPANWPERMRLEWGSDRGLAAAAGHRAKLISGMEGVRKALDDFNPDVIVIWGDDQYENFREDIIPPFSICAYEDMDVRPWGHAYKSSGVLKRENVWGEGEEYTMKVRGRPDIAKYLTIGLLQNHIDVSYAYKPLHHKSLPHAFLNALLFLDYDRKGFDYPIISFPLNCYGRRVISAKGFLSRLGENVDVDPPSPNPARFMEVGAAAVRVLRDSPWRVALMASSSWSHAFLCDKTFHMRPDTPSDRRLYQALQSGDYQTWRNTPLSEVEAAGQQEVLNWWTLLGGMEELGTTLHWSEFVETDVFNSNKVFAVYYPK